MNNITLSNPDAFPAFIADSALSVSGRRPICIFFGVFMAEVAMRFAEVRAFLESLIKHAAAWIKHFCKRQTFSCTRNDGIGFESGLFRQFTRKIFLAFNHQFDRVAPVFVLLFLNGPSAVSRLIVSVIVDPVKRSAGRPFSHVCNEIPKTFTPSFANGDASGSVMLISAIRRIAASSNHRFVASVKRVLFGSHVQPLEYAKPHSTIQSYWITNAV